MDIGKLRERLGLTREEMAVKIGVSIKTVADWETGKHSPSRLAMKRIAEAEKEVVKKSDE